MASVKIHSAEAHSVDAKEEVSVVAKGGHKIVLRQVRGARKMRLLDIIGGESAANSAYLSHALLAAAVANIDDTVYGMPASKQQIEALIDRLDDGETIRMISDRYNEAWLKTTEEIVESAKN